MLEAVILIGIQGAGKSTFYYRYFFNTHMRINLDMLKTRNREKIMLEACLKAKQSFVIDKTNVLERERKIYINLAKAYSFKVTGYFFDVRVREAISRNSRRSGKALIPIKGILGTYKHMQKPSFNEGYDELYKVRTVPPADFQIEKYPHLILPSEDVTLNPEE